MRAIEKPKPSFYSFTATKVDVKVTVDAKTDDRSTPLRVTLMDEDGKELLPIYVVAKGAGQCEVGNKTICPRNESDRQDPAG